MPAPAISLKRLRERADTLKLDVVICIETEEYKAVFPEHRKLLPDLHQDKPGVWFAQDARQFNRLPGILLLG